MANVYLLVALILLLFSFVELKISNVENKKKFFWIFGIFPLILFVGLRGGVDDDYYSYIKYFELAPSLSDFSSGWDEYKEATSGVEIGFALVASFLRSFGVSPESGIFIFAALNFLVIGLIFTRYSISFFYSLFMYYCLFLPTFFTHMRFSLALVLGFYGMMGILTFRLRFISWVWIVISPLIHVGAVVFIPAVWGYRFLGTIKIVQLMVVSLFISVCFLLLDCSSVISFILSFVGGRYEFYANAGTGSVTSAGLRILFLFLFLWGLSGADKVHNLGFKSHRYYGTSFHILLFVYCLSTIVWSISWQVDVLYRLGLALQLSMILLVPYFVYFHRSQCLLSHACVVTSFGIFNMYFFYTLVGGMSVLGDYHMAFQE